MNAFMNGAIDTSINMAVCIRKHPVLAWTVYALQVTTCWGGAYMLGTGFWEFASWLFALSFMAGVPAAMFWRWLSKN